MPYSDKGKLLSDVIRDSEYEPFRARTFRDGLVALRSHRRPPARLERWALAAAIALVLGLGALRFRHGGENIAPTERSGLSSFVSSPLGPKEVIHSSNDPSIVVETAPETRAIDVIETASSSLVEA